MAIEVPVEIPDFAEPTAPGIEHRTQFLHDLGMFVGMWAEWELALEVLIGTLTGATAIDNATVVGTLQYGAKLAIARALLVERGREADARELQAISEVANRNTLMHGVMASEDGFSRFAIYRRAVGRKSKFEGTAADFRQHVDNFRSRVHAAMAKFAIDEGVISEYGRKARLTQ